MFPVPPINVSFPNPPDKISSPSPPSSVFIKLPPKILSAALLPITFSIFFIWSLESPEIRTSVKVEPFNVTSIAFDFVL